MNDLDTETADRDRVDGVEKSRHTAKIFLSGSDCVVILGSKQKTLTIQVLLEKQSKDPAFTSFCTRVSAAIQALTLSPEPTDTVAVNESHQVRFFISLTSCFTVIIHTLPITSRSPSIGSSRWNMNRWLTGTSK
jgi:hypothetical protein